MAGTHTFERVFLRALRLLYDTKKQITLTLPALGSPFLDRELLAALGEIEAVSAPQTERLAEIFRTLYLEPRGEACWVTTALLREALDAAEGDDDGDATEGCAAALLALKRYELTLYEQLLRWSERCDLYEVLPALRRSFAEELLQASILAELAFDSDRGLRALRSADRQAFH